MKDLYKKYERTKERLLLIESLGMEEVSIGQFGIPSYIEMIWDYSDDDFNSYIKWVKILKKRKKK